MVAYLKHTEIFLKKNSAEPTHDQKRNCRHPSEGEHGGNRQQFRRLLQKRLFAIRIVNTQASVRFISVDVAPLMVKKTHHGALLLLLLFLLLGGKTNPSVAGSSSPSRTATRPSPRRSGEIPLPHRGKSAPRSDPHPRSHRKPRRAALRYDSRRPATGDAAIAEDPTVPQTNPPTRRGRASGINICALCRWDWEGGGRCYPPQPSTLQPLGRWAALPPPTTYEMPMRASASVGMRRQADDFKQRHGD